MHNHAYLVSVNVEKKIFISIATSIESILFIARIPCSSRNELSEWIRIEKNRFYGRDAESSVFKCNFFRMLRKREEFLMDVVEEVTWSEKRQGIKREEKKKKLFAEEIIKVMLSCVIKIRKFAKLVCLEN